MGLLLVFGWGYFSPVFCSEEPDQETQGDQEKKSGQGKKGDQEKMGGLGGVDRGDPEAVRRAAIELQEKLRKDREKKSSDLKQRNANQTFTIKSKNKTKETSAESTSEEKKNSPPTKTASVALLEEGEDTTKPPERLRVAVEIGMPKQGSLLERMRTVMAAKCLDNGESGQLYQPPRATVVELDVEKPLVPAGHVEPKVESVDLLKRPDQTAVPENAEELQEEAERRFKAGLDSRDTVIRDWSYRYGAAYRRTEAIPSMARELKSKGWLSTLAATSLGEIAEANNKEAIEALEEGLSSKDAGVRQACVHSLGQLRAESAMRPLAKLIRNERNFQVRAACCTTLGLIGGGDAVGLLRPIFRSPDEPELVKGEAALALARHGDRSGLTYLEGCFGSPAPQLQLLGLMALIELHENSLPSKLLCALGARYDEVWLLAVRTLPSLGPALVQPALRETLGASVPQVRQRAALALGLMGDREALPHIQQALLEGGLAERQMAAELLGLLGHRESIPLLMERVLEPNSAVRMAVAVALVRLDAKEALPALVEAARGPKASLGIALSRDGPLDTRELLLLLGCIRALKGEEGSHEFTTRPDLKSSRWPEYEKELEKYQFDVLRGYQLVEVMGSSAKPVAAVLRDAQGQEQTYRMNEAVASGFRIQEMRVGSYGPNAGADVAWVVLQRGVTRATLLGNGKVEISEVKSNTKK